MSFLFLDSLSSLWWSLLLVVDLDRPTPSTVFLSWPTVVRERNLLSSTKDHEVVFGGLLNLVLLLSSAGYPEVFLPGLLLIMAEGCKQTADVFAMAVPYG